MLRACGMYQNDAKCVQNFLWGGQEDWNQLENNCVNNRTVLKWVIKEIGEGESMDWIHLAEDRDKLWADVCTILILWFQHNVKKYVMSEDCSTTHNLYIVYNVLC
jgi:hypothetical protein